MFVGDSFKVISNNAWYYKIKTPNKNGKQPIDAACTIQALHLFYQVFQIPDYKTKMKIAFRLFLGKN